MYQHFKPFRSDIAHSHSNESDVYDVWAGSSMEADTAKTRRCQTSPFLPVEDSVSVCSPSIFYHRTCQRPRLRHNQGALFPHLIIKRYVLSRRRSRLLPSSFSFPPFMLFCLANVSAATFGGLCPVNSFPTTTCLSVASFLSSSCITLQTNFEDSHVWTWDRLHATPGQLHLNDVCNTGQLEDQNKATGHQKIKGLLSEPQSSHIRTFQWVHVPRRCDFWKVRLIPAFGFFLSCLAHTIWTYLTTVIRFLSGPCTGVLMV